MRLRYCCPKIVFLLSFAVICATAHAQTAPVAVGVTSQPQEAAQDEIQSVLLSDTQLSAINKARKYYEDGSTSKGNNAGNEDDFLSKLTTPTAAAAEYTYPQFFLSSILYHSSEDWVVWINNTKITREESQASGTNLRVLSVDARKAVLEWSPQKTDKVDLANVESNNNIKIDFINNVVVFELHTNQTFTSYSMKIVEGNPPPISIKTK